MFRRQCQRRPRRRRNAAALLEMRGAPVVSHPLRPTRAEKLHQEGRRDVRVAKRMHARRAHSINDSVNQALAAIHEARDGMRILGLVHGGLNPSRILIDQRGRVKVLGLT